MEEKKDLEDKARGLLSHSVILLTEVVRGREMGGGGWCDIQFNKHLCSLGKIMNEIFVLNRFRHKFYLGLKLSSFTAF
jgi:hypothetical protein